MSIVPDNSHVAHLNGAPHRADIVSPDVDHSDIHNSNDQLGDLGGSPHHEGRQASLHRIGAVRREQGVSLRTVSRQWNVDLAEVRRQQQEDTDLPLSQLYRWQEMLGVPVADLLVEDQQPLSDPVLRRAQLVKIMKTAVTLQETAREVRVQRLISTLVEQLTELMPELADVGPWHGSGNRRTLDDFGRAVDYRLSDDVLYG